MTPTQCRMARAALLWSINDLAAASGVDRVLIHRFEIGEATPNETVQILRRTFEKERVRIVMNGSEAGGVVPPKPLPSKGQMNPIIQDLLRRARRSRE